MWQFDWGGRLPKSNEGVYTNKYLLSRFYWASKEFNGLTNSDQND